MRFVYFLLAAVFSAVAVVAANSVDSAPAWIGGTSLLLGGIFLVLGFYEMYKRREEPSLKLDEEERETIRRMKDEGNFQLAVRQVQMWKRGASPEDAARVVREA